MVPVLSALLRSRVALAPEILYFAPLSIVTKQGTKVDTNEWVYCIHSSTQNFTCPLSQRDAVGKRCSLVCTCLVSHTFAAHAARYTAVDDVLSQHSMRHWHQTDKMRNSVMHTSYFLPAGCFTNLNVKLTLALGTPFRFGTLCCQNV